MKRIICLFLTAVILLTGVSALSSCKKNNGPPDGMKLMRGGAEYGYNIYAPVGWTVSNRGEIACAYASRVDTTSVTFVKAKAPSAEGKTRAEATVGYFDEQMAKMPFAVTVDTRGEAAEFGNAPEAYRFTYTYEYEGRTVGVMQLLVYRGEDFYIFTYSSCKDKNEDGRTSYDTNLEAVGRVIATFEFIEKIGEPETPEYERDADGWLIVSDGMIAGFVMSVPDTFTVDYSSGSVSVSREDGGNITMSRMTYTGVDKDTYWERRKKELAQFVDKTDDGQGNEITSLEAIEGEISVPVELDGAKWAYSYEYTYSYDGVKYRVYQVLIVTGMKSFVYTYTATDTCYAAGIDEAKQILGKIEY